ncbi:hypothetical protein Patl1_11410 [Pistacia atlantica]|uniref:Uncharacterized protein n=1 Tax=Pistacia atlantica TaxID=434234 RepID=A0ACC1A5N7_9ROSI|nr:hypothetical protein Patl1_11410 [Pistacia atlantica]
MAEIKTTAGYSDILLVDQHFAVHVPENLALEGVAPLLCAGITVFSPMKFFGLDKAGMHVGVVGLGGWIRPSCGRRTMSASMARGMKETQEMIDFAAKHKSTANVEVISMDYVNKPMDRLAIGDVRYRFVIDAANTLNI